MLRSSNLQTLSQRPKDQVTKMLPRPTLQSNQPWQQMQRGRSRQPVRKQEWNDLQHVSLTTTTSLCHFLFPVSLSSFTLVFFFFEFKTMSRGCYSFYISNFISFMQRFNMRKFFLYKQLYFFHATFQHAICRDAYYNNVNITIISSQYLIIIKSIKKRRLRSQSLAFHAITKVFFFSFNLAFKLLQMFVR